MASNLSILNLTRAESSAIVIPHSTDGFMHEDLVAKLFDLGLGALVPSKASLGSIKILSAPKAGNLSYIILACTNSGGYSDYAAIRSLMLQILEFVSDQDPSFSVTIPLMGSGGGNLETVKVYHLLNRILLESEIKNPIQFCVLDQADLDRVYASTIPNLNVKAINLAFDYCVDDIKNEDWVEDLLHSSEFYFQLARQKFVEFLEYRSSDTNIFKKLEEQFANSTDVFQDFIKKFPESSLEKKILNLCGEVIAYIDRHAFNKQKWNMYEDKRTMALSAVNQTNWVSNLLKYKSEGNDASRVSPSIRNALNYLKDPHAELIMLSESHRKLVAEKLLHINYVKSEFIESIRTYLRPRVPACSTSLNDNVLLSRILYSPPIALLWQIPKKNVPNPKRDTIEAKTVTDEPEVTEAKKRQELLALIHSDSYAQFDMLGYEAYASVIASFLTSGHTKPPLTIGIFAPWGKGKTSLMRFIEQKIKGRDSLGTEKINPVAREETASDRKALYSWLKNQKELFTIKKISYPIIWFNAWKFQKNEQIWAGLANEIISQLAANLSDLDREKFYLRLNLKRVDKDKIRQEIMLGALAKLFFPALISLFLFLTNYIVGQLGNLIPVLPLQVMGLASVGLFLTSGLVNIFLYLKKSPGADLSKYVLQPDYKNKMGYYAAVEEDLRHALEILVNTEEPPVIFIDDLDRCATNTITELIEAINLFISGDISTCYFIIGQDAQIVSAALDASYDKVGEKLVNVDKHHGSIGWYFLEKFIQLQFNIPVITEFQSGQILGNLLSLKDQDKIPDQAKQAILLERYLSIERSISTLDDLEQIFTKELESLEAEIALFDRKRIATFQDKIIKRAMQDFEVTESGLEEVVKSIGPFVKNSPRVIKRFANLYVFYQFLKFSNSCKGLRKIDDLVLGKWVLIMIRWPQLIRSIQWDAEKNFITGHSAMERASAFDTAIKKAQTLDSWIKTMKEKGFDAESWVCDAEFFIFFQQLGTDESLKNAVNSGLW